MTFTPPCFALPNAIKEEGSSLLLKAFRQPNQLPVMQDRPGQDVRAISPPSALATVTDLNLALLPFPPRLPYLTTFPLPFPLFIATSQL